MVAELEAILSSSIVSAIIAKSTAPAPIVVAKATAPEPSKVTALAVTSPVNEKFLAVVKVAALPLVF